VWLVFFAFTLAALAQDVKCEVCGHPLVDRYYERFDRVEGRQRKICQVCDGIVERCFICDMPIRGECEKISDGRYLCSRDMKTVVQTDDEALEICRGVRDGLDRMLSRFLTFPDDDVQISVTDRFHLESLFKAPGAESRCVSVYGATATHFLPGHKYVHTVDVLSHLPKPHLMAVSAHEFTHTWIDENVLPARHLAMDKNAVEGFCELVAYKYMESLHEDAEMERIKSNSYTVGQVLVMIEAENKYGFNTVMEWMKYGEDTRLDLADLDRVRAVKDAIVHSASAAPPQLVYATPVVPTAVPDTLVLKGISGAGQHRFALINNATFEAREHGKVRVGQATLTVNCLEIGNDSVTIQIDGSPEKTQLFLRKEP
jgi:hypothetical protein